MNSVIAGVYDFEVAITGCETLTYKDESIWMEGPQFSPPSVYTLRIQAPDGRSADVEVSAVSANRLSGEDLGFGKCFPGGIYCLSAVGGPGVGHKTFTRKAALLCSQYCGLQKVIAQIPGGLKVERAMRLQAYLKYAEVAAHLGDEQTAQQWIGLVDEELILLNCKCKC